MKDIVLDAHFDVLLDVLYYRRLGERKVLERRHLRRLKSSGVNVLVCSLFITDDLLPEGALRNALDQISAFMEELEESGDSFALCRDTKEARLAVEEGKIAVFLSLEGAEPIGRDLLLLRTFYDLGVRLLGVTWSRRNYAADGSSFDPEYAPKHQGGLTRFGRELVEKAQELGMVIDVSHINDEGFYEIASMVKGPFIASHSNCRALASSARNLTDDQIKAIAASGGVIGMNAYSPFSSDCEEERTAEKLMEHLCHVIKTAGFSHVGLGMDLCDCLYSLRMSHELNDGDLFRDHEDAGERFLTLIRERFPKEISREILGENFFKLFERVLG